jgi:hypothetical protein
MGATIYRTAGKLVTHIATANTHKPRVKAETPPGIGCRTGANGAGE